MVPAHNEAQRGFRVLPAVREAASRRDVLVVVVCNGCTDETAELAKSDPAITVLELAAANKGEALNEGDRFAGSVFPRLYLDADVELAAESLFALFDALATDEPFAVGPSVEFWTEEAPLLVRAFYRALVSLPFLVAVRKSHLDGRGVYGVNAAGRERFGQFPPVRGDDTFFDRMFSDHEKSTVESARVILRVPASTSSFLRARARAAQSSHETTAWISANYPDRLVVSAAQSNPLDSMWSRIHHHHLTSGLVPSWSFGSLGALAAFVLVEAIARGRATALRLLGRTTRWR